MINKTIEAQFGWDRGAEVKDLNDALHNPLDALAVRYGARMRSEGEARPTAFFLDSAGNVIDHRQLMIDRLQFK